MNTPIQIAFLGMPSSEPLATAIRDRSQALETHGARIIACHVSVELEGRHQTQGRLVTVRLVVTVAGHQLVISRCSHEDAYRAVHEAFDDMGRQLSDAAGVRVPGGARYRRPVVLTGPSREGGVRGLRRGAHGAGAA